MATMRLPEDQIKEAILHADPEIRDRAALYFATSFSADSSIMPLVVQTVETHGKQDAYRLIGSSRDLPQTEETVAWVIDELNADESDQYENYTYNLSMVLMEADPTLLLPRESDILEARHFLPDLRAPFTERLQMLSWDSASCWQKLEAFCKDAKDKQYANEINLSHAKRIVEALARYGQECEAKVRTLLSQKVDDFDHNPMKWLEPLAVRLAGQARLNAEVPLILAKLHEDAGDLLNEECAEALTRIGTPSVVQAVAEAFPSAPFHFRLFAINALEDIRSDLAVEKLILLFGQEKELSIKQSLANALLSQFAEEGIEAARSVLVGQELDFEGRGLRNYLVETCTIMGQRFPEYEQWLSAEKVEKEEHNKRVQALANDPKGLMLYALEKLGGQKALDRPKVTTAPRTPLARLTSPRKPEAKQRIGRNDSCPCGSGKKFKNCCMNKPKGF
jgi:hypothetical protein